VTPRSSSIRGIWRGRRVATLRNRNQNIVVTKIRKRPEHNLQRRPPTPTNRRALVLVPTDTNRRRTAASSVYGRQYVQTTVGQKQNNENKEK